MNDLGSLKQEVLRLLAKVPAPPNAGIPSGVLGSRLEPFEQRTGLKVPTNLRDWLTTCNGPCVGPGGVYGIEPEREAFDIEQLMRLRPIWLEKGWIPVAGDGCGNCYVVPSRNDFGVGEPVVFVDTMEDDGVPAYIVASDIWRFLKFLFMQELSETGWPFEREEVSHLDPDILNFGGVALPWNA